MDRVKFVHLPGDHVLEVHLPEKPTPPPPYNPAAALRPAGVQRVSRKLAAALLVLGGFEYLGGGASYALWVLREFVIPPHLVYTFMRRNGWAYREGRWQHRFTPPWWGEVERFCWPAGRPQPDLSEWREGLWQDDPGNFE